ncbi:MAG: DNA cytosine methyltransferase [Treponema sp.]|nr:DNA cytosine methyltransferase [Spirochaetia bacterium]MDY3758377.1 DNA cytosine methyltransferase [Treponema sp.]
MSIKTVGSICSGIEAASVAWKDFNFDFKWFSEIADFQSEFLSKRYPNIPNLGDMNYISEKILNKEIEAPDMICGGTPCQAFSLAGFQNGLNDERGNLTLKFCEIVNSNDKIRLAQGKDNTIIFWENVEGVLKDKTNAFGCFLALLSGCKEELKLPKWPNSGLLRGPERNVAWRILDAKYFGLPQQRRRLYVVAGGKNFHPENVLFEKHLNQSMTLEKYPLVFFKNGHKYEVFREYTDCLYSAYGTKWNGNAAAYNGSLFVVQDDRIRRLTPLECERLMGFPDDYTLIDKVKPTNRYQGVGNSWAVPVVKWIGSRLLTTELKLNIDSDDMLLWGRTLNFNDNAVLYDFGKEFVSISDGTVINATEIPENVISSNIANIIDYNDMENLFISPVGCAGILRRKNERKLKINQRLEEVLISISSQWTEEEIEKKSLIQPRGSFSKNLKK